MAVAFDPEEKTLNFAIKDFEPSTQRLLMSTLDVNGLILDLPSFKAVVAQHIKELIKNPAQLELAKQVASRGQVLPLLRDETNALNFEWNTYQIQLSNLGKEASSTWKLCVDFDGTLSKTTEGKLGEPFEGAIASLQKFKELGYTIVIYSCRALSDKGIREIEAWLNHYACPYDEIFKGKPYADYYIDDRAIPFNNNWNSVLEQVSTRVHSSTDVLLVVKGMYQEFDKNNPLIPLIEEWKKTTNIKSEEYEDLVGKSKDGEPVVVTYKIDGEFTAWEYKSGKAVLVSREGRVREDFPVTQDIVKALSKHKEAIGFGELYVVDKEGNSLPYPKASSILRKPLSAEEENRIRFAIFDIQSLDGKKVESPYWERFLLIKELFSNANHVEPIPAKQGNKSTIQEMWENGVPEHYEGLVIHYDGVVKAKPILSQDLAVIFVERSKKHPEIMGALGLAYLDKEGNYHSAGKVGTGFSDEDRVMWMSYALKNKLRDEDSTIWVKPTRVVEVASKELNLRKTPLLDKSLNEIGEAESAVGREPRFVQVREDKKVTPLDVRLEQIPSSKKEATIKEADFPKHPDTLMIEPNEWYNEGLREEDVWNWYNSVKDKLLLSLKGTPTFLVLKTDGEHIRRNEAKTGEKIQVNTIEDINRLNTGRTIEFHFTVADSTTKKIWVDLDPKENYPWQEVKKVAEEIRDLMAKLPDVEQTEVRFSGGRGIHCLAFLRKPVNVDAAREMLNNLLEEEIVPRHKNTSIHISKSSDQMRLDTTTLHKDGSLRALWSLNAKTGLVCSQIDNLETAEKKDFTILKMNRSSSGFKFDPNSTENEGRWRLRDPKDFEQGSFRRWSEWAGVKAPQGIQFLVGDLTSKKKALQAIRFDKSLWTESKASSFWKSIQNKKGFERSWTWPSGTLSAKEVSSAFLPSLPGVVWEVHDGPDMQHSPSTPLEMLHPVNQDNTYDTYTTIYDKKNPKDLLHFLTLDDIEEKSDQGEDPEVKKTINDTMNNVDAVLSKRDIAKQAATNEEHLAHIKELVNQRQFEKAVAYLNDNKLNAPKLLKDLEDRSSKATILNKDQALLLIEKGSPGAQSNAVKWLAKNNNVTELAAAVSLVAFNPSIAKEIVDIFKANRNVIVLNRLYANTSIPEGIRKEVVEALISINYVPIIDEAIKDNSEQIRSTAYKAASRMKAKDHLMEEGTKDPSAKIRKEVYGYLWEAQTPAALDLFYKGQKDSDPSIQGFVKEKIGLSKGHSGEPPLKGDELTKDMLQKGITDAEEYFKQRPDLKEKLEKELKEREETIKYNKSLLPEAPKKSSLDKEAIQPPAGMTMAIEPAFEWGERDDGLLAKDVKQYYGRPKSEWRNNLGLLPEFLKKMVEDEFMNEEENIPVKLGAGTAALPPGTPFRLKVNVGGAPAGTPGYILWQTEVPTTYYVWIKGIESEPTDIPLPIEYMDLNSKVTPEVEELGQSVADQIREEIKKEKEENAPQTPADVKVMDSKTLKHKRDEMLDNMLKHPEGSPERKKWEERLKALGTRVAPSNPDTDLMDLVYYPNSDKARGVLDRISDSPEFIELILRRARELKDNGRISDRQMSNLSQVLHNLALGKGTINPGQKIVAQPLSQKESASNVYDDYEQTVIDDGRRLERTEDDEGVLIMDRDWISDTQTFPRGVPAPPARWIINDDEREGEEGKPGVGGTKLRNGPVYWEPSPGNLDGMPAGQSLSSLEDVSFSVEFCQEGGRISCTWDKEDIVSKLNEEDTISTLTRFARIKLSHVLDKYKDILPEHVDLHNRTLVLKFQGDKQEPNEKK